MARLPVATKDMVPQQFAEAFEELTTGSGGTITAGPGSITIYSPEMARRRGNVTNYLRYESTFSRNIQEIAILTAARSMDCQYIWNAHAPMAREAGVSDALVDALRDNKPLPNTNPQESAIISYGKEFFNTHKISTETFQTALAQFGPQHLVELTALMGHYAQTAFFLNAFTVELPERRTEPVLPV